MTEELKPCPFCGNTKNYHGATSQMDMIFDALVACPNCDGMVKHSARNIESALTGAARAWNHRASPWIRVEDGLPKHGQRVFVKNGDIILALIFNEELSVFMSRASTAMHHSVKDVTHWMPIPPIGGENE